MPLEDLSSQQMLILVGVGLCYGIYLLARRYAPASKDRDGGRGAVVPIELRSEDRELIRQLSSRIERAGSAVEDLKEPLMKIGMELEWAAARRGPRGDRD